MSADSYGQKIFDNRLEASRDVADVRKVLDEVSSCNMEHWDNLSSVSEGISYIVDRVV